MSEVFNKLSTINVNELKERKGKFDYLPWTDAWQILMENYPEATHDMLEDVIYPDGTMEVRSSVTIEGQTLKCFLPVIDHRNQAIQHPNAFDVNKNRMRCLAKNIALFGLGLYIFRGEDLPSPSVNLQEKYDEMVALTAKRQCWELKKFMDDNRDHTEELFNMAPQGKKTAFKSDVRSVYAEANNELKATLAALEDAVGNPDSDYNVVETMGELSELETQYVNNAMNEILASQVRDAMEKAV